MVSKLSLSPLVVRLKSVTSLDDRDVEAIEALPIEMKVLKNNHAIVTTGDRPSACCLIIDGFVMRAKSTHGGKRQILSIHQPGDIPDLQSLYLHVMDHDVVTLGEGVLGFIQHDVLRGLIRAHPSIAEVLWRDTLIDAAIFREWILNVGQRDVQGRIAHLLLETFNRLKLIGRVKENTFRFPITQGQLGEAVGATSVHVNRTIQELRAQGLVELASGSVTIRDETRLCEIAGFDPLYLHMRPDL
jgi:CRP-like cAMP-binding protein